MQIATLSPFSTGNSTGTEPADFCRPPGSLPGAGGCKAFATPGYTGAVCSRQPNRRVAGLCHRQLHAQLRCIAVGASWDRRIHPGAGHAGVNVWCAAGEGTFGTDELVRRIEACQLNEVVSQRQLILPQLGAPGIAAHEVRKRSGFKVEYGPVRAADLPEYLKTSAGHARRCAWCGSHWPTA